MTESVKPKHKDTAKELKVPKFRKIFFEYIFPITSLSIVIIITFMMYKDTKSKRAEIDKIQEKIQFFESETDKMNKNSDVPTIKIDSTPAEKIIYFERDLKLNKEISEFSSKNIKEIESKIDEYRDLCQSKSSKDKDFNDLRYIILYKNKELEFKYEEFDTLSIAHFNLSHYTEDVKKLMDYNKSKTCKTLKNDDRSSSAYRHAKEQLIERDFEVEKLGLENVILELKLEQK